MNSWLPFRLKNPSDDMEIQNMCHMVKIHLKFHLSHSRFTSLICCDVFVCCFCFVLWFLFVLGGSFLSLPGSCSAAFCQKRPWGGVACLASSQCGPVPCEHRHSFHSMQRSLSVVVFLVEVFVCLAGFPVELLPLCMPSFLH